MPDIQPVPSPCGGPLLAELRRFDTGELSGATRDGLRTHVDTCQRCQATLRDFAADRIALQTALPFAALERRVAARPTLLSRLWRRTTLVAFGISLAAAAVLLVAKPRTPVDGGSGSFTRTKGGVSLDFLVKRGDEVEAGHDGDRMRAGDALEFRYSAAGLPYILIAGVDADGKVFPYFTAGDRSAQASPGRVLTSKSVVLDADTRPERVFAIYSREPIAVDELKPAVRDGLAAAHGRIDALTKLPGFADQATLLLNKAAP